MQGNTVLAVRYAQSLASLAQEKGSLDVMYSDMQKISEVFASEAEFRAFFAQSGYQCINQASRA